MSNITALKITEPPTRELHNRDATGAVLEHHLDPGPVLECATCQEQRRGEDFESAYLEAPCRDCRAAGVRLAARAGMGATVSVGSDRYAATVISVNSTKINVRVDRAIRLDNNGLSEDQHYAFEPDPQGVVLSFRLSARPRGKTARHVWRDRHGRTLRVGVRSAYQDPSF